MYARLVQPVRAYKKTRYGKSKIFRDYKPNQKVKGKLSHLGLLPENQILILETAEGFMIPPHFLIEIRPQEQKPKYETFDESEVVSDKDLVNKETLTKIKDSKILDVNNIISNTKIKSKYLIQGAIYGGLVMLVFAMYKGKNKLLFSSIGAVGGGVLGNLYKKHIA